jgi:MFS family permease
VIPDAPKHRAGPSDAGAVRVRAVIRAHRDLYLALGIAVVAVAAVRAGRQTVLPLWGEQIGLSATGTSVVFGIAKAVDMALFYPSGLVMDRRGRRMIALPPMLLLAVGTAVLPLTSGVVAFTLVAILISFGIGAGFMMTLGADAAPSDSRTTFLSVWRLLSDSGNALGPVIVSALAAVSTLAVGIVGIGSVGLVAAAALGRWAPRYSPYWHGRAEAFEVPSRAS